MATGFVITAGGHVKVLKQILYRLIAWIPRRMPQTEDEWEQMQDDLMRHHGVQDEPLAWAAIAGQITSTKATTMRRTYRGLSNVAKRLKVNQLAHEKKLLAYAQNEATLKAKLQVAIDKVIDDTADRVGYAKDNPTVHEGPLNIPGDLPTVPQTQN